MCFGKYRTEKEVEDLATKTNFGYENLTPSFARYSP